MFESEAGRETSLLGTLEEISRLVISHVGDPGETLTECVSGTSQGQSRPIPISIRFSVNSSMSPNAFNCAAALWIA